MDFIIENNKIYKKDGSGRLIAEITYEDLGNNMYNIDHTFVDESLRGQGIAQMLVEEALKEINKKGSKHTDHKKKKETINKKSTS